MGWGNDLDGTAGVAEPMGELRDGSVKAADVGGDSEGNDRCIDLDCGWDVKCQWREIGDFLGREIGLLNDQRNREESLIDDSKGWTFAIELLHSD